MTKTNVTKRCSRCKIPKPLSEYHKNISTPDKLSSSCKECKRLNDRLWYLKKKDTILKKRKKYLHEWKKKNKEHIKEYNIKRYKKNKKEILKTVKAYQKKIKKKLQKKHKQ